MACAWCRGTGARPLHALLAFGLAFLPQVAPSAPLVLAQAPLFLGKSVPPNLILVYDDSGSMEWEFMVQEGHEGRPYASGWFQNYYLFPSPNNSKEEGLPPGYHPWVAPSVDQEPESWRLRNHRFNLLYYNPEVTYRPWPGLDPSGAPLYGDAPPTAAPADPADPAAGTLDLTQAHSYLNTGWNGFTNYNFFDTLFPAEYYRWIDSDGDGVVDPDDAHERVRIEPSTPTYMGGPNRTDCAAAPVCTYAEEIQNFANWYTYYRKRGFAAKAALGEVIASSTGMRMGLWRIFRGLGRAVEDMGSPAARRGLLEALYATPLTCEPDGCPGTPTRHALDAVGRMLMGTLPEAPSPILDAEAGGTCQQNFALVLTDGWWDGGYPPAGIGNEDGDGDTAFDGPPYADGQSGTLADVAMRYYEKDLRPDLADEVTPIPGVDEAEHQHLVTFGVAFGVRGELDPAEDDPRAPGFAWPTISETSNDPARIDDLWHAAFNGRGRFLLAPDPQDLRGALLAYLEDIARRGMASAASVSFSGRGAGGGQVFLALFNSDGWSGDLRAYRLDAGSGRPLGEALWSAAERLDGRSLAQRPRTVLTYDGQRGVPLRWERLSPALRADLRTNPTGGLDAEPVGRARLEFLRGAREHEGRGYGFRSRRSRLGDIVHSAPVYVGAPELPWPDQAPFPTSTPYSAFREALSGRQGMVYVGANDGMLHGFDARTGEERLAYLPAALASDAVAEGLHYLTDPAYGHRYYVDMTVTVSDAYVAGRSGGTAWRTVLVGGLGAGGRGVFALDVTDPGRFSEERAEDLVLWEFDAGDDPDLGHSFGQATVALLPNGRWAAILGNGYGDQPGGSGRAQLFILFLDGGLDGSWTPGEDYLKLDTGVGGPEAPNGLSTPAVVDVDGDGVADRAYAGDLRGNLWAFDLSSSQPSQWGVAHRAGGHPQPLFSQPGQPITGQPAVVRHPAVADQPSNRPNLLVLFGTGRFLAVGDRTDTAPQSFYAVWDRGEGGIGRNRLQPQHLLDGYPDEVRVTSSERVDYAGSPSQRQYGWRFDLPTPGERVVSGATVRGGLVFFTTVAPSLAPCAFGGRSWLMALRIADGGRPRRPAFDLDGDGRVGPGDLVLRKAEGEEEPDEGEGRDPAAPSGRRAERGLIAAPVFRDDRAYLTGSDTQDGSGIEVRAVRPLGGARTGRLSWGDLTR